MYRYLNVDGYTDTRRQHITKLSDVFYMRRKNCCSPIPLGSVTLRILPPTELEYSGQWKRGRQPFVIQLTEEGLRIDTLALVEERAFPI